MSGAAAKSKVGAFIHWVGDPLGSGNLVLSALKPELSLHPGAQIIESEATKEEADPGILDTRLRSWTDPGLLTSRQSTKPD